VPDIVLKDAFDEYLARIVCFCFSISPQPFVSQTNRATAETAKAQATEEGLGPVLNWFKRLIDQIVQRHLGYAGLEFVWIDDREMDPSAADAIDVADVKAGIRTINEVRMARGLDPLPGGDRLMVSTGTGYVPVTQDGAGAPAPAKFVPRPQSGLGKFNPNHWPAHSPDRESGEFSPKGEGGDTGLVLASNTAGASANARQASSSMNHGDFDSFGNRVTPEERALMDTMPAPGSDAIDGSRLTGPALEALEHDLTVEPPGPQSIGTHGYVPQPGDRDLLARAIFAEGSDTPKDIAAIAWAIVNRIGHPKFRDSLDAVIQEPGQYAFMPTKGKPLGSDQWNNSANPDKLNVKDARAWQQALAAAEGVLGGTIPDPTGGATYYFLSSTYNGTLATAPKGFFRMALGDNRLNPSPYVSEENNHFFLLNPESSWNSFRSRRRHR
jgi:hypothetical protein